MINNIIAFSIRNKLIIGLLTLALIVGGFWSISKVPIDAVPDITNNQVQVITQTPSLGTEDVEQFITYQIELAMANLPGVVELRSVSRSGLSLVTIVFEDEMGIYLPRQLVAEKLSDVKEEIPQSIGSPFLGPISTGLGEIYQYTLEVDPEFKEVYSGTELRTIQDWIIRRQMAMVPGVVEVNGFGGNVKQYEIALRPDALKAMGLSISDIYTALEKNNENAGGAYIEKYHQAQFIRAEGLARSIEDIESIVVDSSNDIPVTIKDIAEVRFGSDIRFGAFTKDGKGEAVGGMILMLKGANSNNVIESVKERVREIQGSLPEGVSIKPFLDRSKLIDNTTSTVSNNLMEGALIVIFILVFLLGNWRGGLIVASTIPLSLLFAFILMNVFDVWANLMSLGAIDFGIIIDGAVIIVESTVFLLNDRVLKKQSINAQEKDEITKKASSKMMNSAFFGQLIILIVFIPILALEGIEGKMFKPMALTFMFAMIGVMILCLTYIPMMSAWLLKVPKNNRLSIGDKLVHKIELIYDKLLNFILPKFKWVLISALILLGFSAFIFSRLGGEFIPKLDEGDIAFHDILKPGTSLSETLIVTTKVENLIKDNFPEVENVLSRIGVADVPTDPMPMDVADCFIILKPKEDWVSASTKAELVEKIKNKVLEVPGVNYEFTQPIEMRFNELITGVREDVAIKLFGDDLDVLASKAEEIGKLIQPISGIADMKVETTKGLPQITVDYQRDKLAQYGLNISDLNTTIQSAFSGGKAGVIFEGEKRFDLVVRLDQRHRQSLDDLKMLYINLANGNQVPLKELADIKYQTGPMQISRENTNRRTYVGINVRGRDVKSLVQEIQQKLNSELELPAGYYIRYGGAFENLERATKRLQIVVPIALGLIFLLIFMALKSIKQTIMIYIAIPLAAIGGIFSLWLRDMPFSISAGIGFIVLFGIAVLNGLVLVSGWNELKANGVTNLKERISLGGKRRIRPILLTATTDILGFLPMAISSSAGAEVQRPLATVVIGGMISATLLTLFVLPILYQLFERRAKKKISNPVPIVASLVLLLIIPVSSVQAQSDSKSKIGLNEALSIGLKNNGNIMASSLEIDIQEKSRKKAFSLPKTAVKIQYGQYNSFENDLGLNVSQNIEFPTVYTLQRELAKEELKESNIHLSIAENDLKFQIRHSWYELNYLENSYKLLLLQDSVYRAFIKAAKLRYETGESSYLEMISAESRFMEVQNKIQMQKSDIEKVKYQLSIFLNDGQSHDFLNSTLEIRQMPLVTDTIMLGNNPFLMEKNQMVSKALVTKKLESAKALPDLSFGYFNQSMAGNLLSNGNVASSNDRFAGFTAGIRIPLFFNSYNGSIQAAKLDIEKAQVRAQYLEQSLQNQLSQQFITVTKQRKSLEYFQTKAIPQADLIIKNAKMGFENQSIDYLEYVHNLDTALELKNKYLQTVKAYNNSVIELEYLLGQ